MIPDVKLNGKSVREMGWIRENIDFPTPQSQTNTIVVPGRNSPIRYTEALGRVSYQPRSFTIVLSILGTRKQYDQKISELVNQYAGKLKNKIAQTSLSGFFLMKSFQDLQVCPAEVSGLQLCR